ncbi:unnamed protein product [Vitrella brassicaformis CCMP3155]|uniref:Uncharacterized protein n=1 Tax=Vitrella brassicaformis (strain CCMP3155) TaxID=1169540 RepID=A0A0G4G1J9_VITBC|nr:unnamed protein product [Vitrella brassicaformis CCMP3155]|eukprot:CEM21751.1 unnamed protein product [Vitrella brassicaformis CCMP3155]
MACRASPSARPSTTPRPRTRRHRRIAGGRDLIGTVEQEDPVIETVRAPTMIDAKLALPGGSADRHYFDRHVLRAATDDEKAVAERVHDAMGAHYQEHHDEDVEEDDGCHT